MPSDTASSPTKIVPTSLVSTPEHILPELAAIEDSRDIDGVLILLNTMGGDVEAGLAIAEMIASLSKPTVSLVLGGLPWQSLLVWFVLCNLFISAFRYQNRHPITLATTPKPPSTNIFFQSLLPLKTAEILTDTQIQ